jgi:amino acid adenylation domain-containing protein
MQGDQPVQEIGDRKVSLQITDCGNYDDEALQRCASAAYRQPFDLEQGPVFRVNLFTRASDDHVLLVTVHHIVYDAWSLWLNLDEIGRLYAANVAGTGAQLPVLDFSYRDYIRRQQETLAGPEGERLWKFWQGELGTDLETLQLPTDRPRPPVQTYAGASHRFWLGPELSRQVRTLAQSLGVTPFTLLLAAFQVLLHRYSGQDDIVVGSPTTGRGDSQFGGIVGYFVNPVVLRANLAANPAFATFVRDVAKTVVNALEHQDFPFPLLVERLQPRRDPRYAPLFQVSFVYQKPQRSGGTTDWLSWSGAHGKRSKWGGLDIEFFDQPQQEGQFDLELEVLDAADGLYGSFKYNTDLFTPATVAQMSQCFRVLLNGITAHPELPVRRLPLIDVEEAQLLKQRAPRLPSVPAQARCLHRTFEAQVYANPKAIAVSDTDEQLTYAQLNERANRLAHHLIALGVKPETRVGICLERSSRMLVAMLATVKAGGAYVPIAPEAPRERNAFIVEDSQVAVLLTHSRLGDEFAAASTKVVHLDTQWPLIQALPASNPDIEVSVDNLLYVIYTSGSTGKPKGALITHFNVARLFTSTHEWFRFDASDVWTLFHSFAFDFSVWEIWGALLYGGRLVVVPYLVSRAPEEFIDLINREGVTVLNQTPSAFRQLSDAEERRPLRKISPLRWVIFGGEALDLKMLTRWYDRHNERHPRLVNMYGITETTVHVTYRPLGMHDVALDKSVIGQPIADLQVHVLDEALEPVPVGVPGEIYVAGDGLCRGYLNRAQLTAERFIECDTGAGGKSRFYRTGDLARRLRDGDIEYLGRVDDQVKIRGFRIELGEIQAVLSQCPDVRSAAVIVRDDDADKRLVAYFVSQPERTPTVAVLREFLLARLPEYMVPSAFVNLEQLPLNSNGKLDRRALPAPPQVRESSASTYVPPRDTVEQAIVGHWEAVLKVRPISVRDNFFELGGHSLLAVNLIARLEKEFARSLPLATLFRRPTVEQLAQLLREQASAGSASLLVPIQSQGAGAPFFCVAGGGGSVLYYYPLAHHMGSQRPFLALQAIGLDGDCEPAACVEDLAAAYVKEIRAAQPQGPYLLGGHCFGGLVAFEISQQLRRQGQEVALLVLMDVPARYLDNGVDPAKADDTTWLVKLAGVVSESTGADLGVTEDVLRQLDAEAQLQFFNERMQAMGFLPPGADVAKMRGLLRVFAANSTARYTPHNVQPVPIVLLRAGEFHRDYDFSPADDPGCSIADSTLGWNKFASGPVAVHVVPGNHITMMSDPNVTRLAQQITTCLQPLEATQHNVVVNTRALNSPQSLAREKEHPPSTLETEESECTAVGAEV